MQLLITPGTTAYADTASHKLFANGFLLDTANVQWFFDRYVDFHHRRDWRFAPLETPDLEGVAPACIVLAECDPLVDEGLAYGDRLRTAGVAVELELYRGLTHDFIKMGRAIPEALAAQAACAAAADRGGTASYLDPSEGAAPAWLEGCENLDLVCFDGLDAVSGDAAWNEALFRLHTLMQDTPARLCVATERPPATVEFQLPDLRSRLLAGSVHQLHELDDAALHVGRHGSVAGAVRVAGIAPVVGQPKQATK